MKGQTLGYPCRRISAQFSQYSADWLLIPLALLVSCQSAARRADNSTTKFKNADKLLVDSLTNDDFHVIAHKFVVSLLESDVLKSVATRPAMITVGRIINNTTSRLFHSDLLTHKIGVALSNNGKAQMIGATLQNQVSLRPDFILHGKVIEARQRNGRELTIAYTFQLSLQNATGVNVWQDEVILSKRTRSALSIGTF